MTGEDKALAAARGEGRDGQATEAEPEALGQCVHHGTAAAADRSSDRGPLPPPIGGRLRDLRQRKGLTLSDVESLSGISKSMLSQIERGRVNPTFATLWNLTRSLDVAIGDLVEQVSASSGNIRAYEHVSVESTPIMTRTGGQCFTRVLSPRRYPYPVEWYELVMKPGGALRANAHGNGAWEHVTVVTGDVVMEIGDDDVPLKAGETVRYSGDQPHGTRNVGKTEARLFIVVVPYADSGSFDPTAWNRDK